MHALCTKQATWENPGYPMDRRLGGPQGLSGRCGEHKYRISEKHWRKLVLDEGKYDTRFFNNAYSNSFPLGFGLSMFLVSTDC